MRGDQYEITPEKIAIIREIAARHSGISGTAQRACVLEILRAVRNASTYELSRFGGVFDPRPRIFELRAEGYDIKTSRRQIQTESGELHSLGVYTLMAEPGHGG